MTGSSTEDRPTVAVCICTRNRPAELRSALASLERSSRPVDQVVVADDSTDGRSLEMVRREHPRATYLRGPGRGLGPNRNAAADAAATDHVLFLDDDAELGERFLDLALDRLARAPGSSARTIVAGGELKDGVLVRPHDQSFLGFQHRPYRSGEPLATVVINGALFPRALFEHVRFDERLVYGYDEVDLTTRAVRAGFGIAPCPEAVNVHRPAASNRALYEPYTEASRLYVTFKRYALTEARPAKGVAFLALAAAHVVAAAARADGARGLAAAARTLRTAGAYIVDHLRERARSGR